MWNKIKIYLSIILVVSCFTACQQIVNLDLHNCEPRLVINASISPANICHVDLTMTQGFYDTTEPPRVSGAHILLTDGSGNVDLLKETSPGVYTSSLQGSTLDTYTLKVAVNNKVYVAKATIPDKVQIDSIKFFSFNMKKDVYIPEAYFDDPKGIVNYYYASLKVNGKSLKTIYLKDDEYFDGVKSVDWQMSYNASDNGGKDLLMGDTVGIQMETIDAGSYRFFQSAAAAFGGNKSNAISNFSGDVLGVFKAYNLSDYKEAVISSNIIHTCPSH